MPPRLKKSIIDAADFSRVHIKMQE